MLKLSIGCSRNREGRKGHQRQAPPPIYISRECCTNRGFSDHSVKFVDLSVGLQMPHLEEYLDPHKHGVFPCSGTRSDTMPGSILVFHTSQHTNTKDMVS